MVFSTVHKAKGMEFDTVMLTDDFSTLGYPFEKLTPFEKSMKGFPIIKLCIWELILGKLTDQCDQEYENELNILYVAATRAKKCLLLNSSLYYILLGAGVSLSHFRPRMQPKNPGKCWKYFGQF